jgi:hypothetical protein
VSLRLPPPEGGDLRRRPIRPGRQRGRVTPRGCRAELTFAKRCCAALGVLAAAVSCCVLLQLRGHAGVHHWAFVNHSGCSPGVRESLWLFTGRSGITSVVHWAFGNHFGCSPGVRESLRLFTGRLGITSAVHRAFGNHSGCSCAGAGAEAAFDCVASLPLASCHWLRFPGLSFIGVAEVLFHLRPVIGFAALRFPWRHVSGLASPGTAGPVPGRGCPHLLCALAGRFRAGREGVR